MNKSTLCPKTWEGTKMLAGLKTQSPGKFFQTNDYVSSSRKQNLHVLLPTVLSLRRSPQPLPWVLLVMFQSSGLDYVLTISSDSTVNQGGNLA
ncbi:hypothetical protein E5288_WYG006749 [Bos mutus]|uniref:Uncharacterized protein n=1 Tax=Bos mutus TaxID=72004 RepID=A0A6B0RGF4_9CETA|nr:hypothetical protein [Bos mutus]